MAAAFGGGSEMLGLVVLGGGLAGDSGGVTLSFSSTASFSLDLTQLSATETLAVGLLDPESDGAGFDTSSS